MDRILKFVKNPRVKIKYFDTLPSTNAYLKEMAEVSEEGLVVIAESQTEGHGRFNRRFYSPENSGIYMSILLKPDSQGFDTAKITTAAAVAVAESAEEFSGKKTHIKWVNDVLINGKKICGILTEGRVDPKTGKPIYIVLGIGINVFVPQNGFDSEIENIAAAVFDRPNIDLKNQLAARIIDKVFEYCYSCNTEIFQKYKSRLEFLGQKIEVSRGEQKTTAKALDIDSDCRLLVEYESGGREYLSSGEISIKI